MKKTLLSALLLSGVSLFAGEPSLIKLDKGNEFLKEGNTLSFRKAEPKRNILKLKETRFSGSGKEWDEAEVTGGGLFINFGLVFPPTSYVNNDYDSDTDPKYGLGFNFELGNYFRFAKIADGKFGVGLRATWLSFGYAKTTLENDIFRVAEMSFLRVGPQFGVGLNEKMGLDFFYQLGYNLTVQFADIDIPGQESIGVSSSYQGLSHEIGAAFHYQVFSVGLGYRFGKLNNILNIVDGEDLGELFLDDEKSSVNSLRITLGFKF